MNDDLQLDVWSHNETQRPRQRVVMLGASNLSLAFPIAISMSQQVFDGPLDFFVAKGHGRSYGKESNCLGKKLSGIFSCGIWRALEQEKSVPITAFVTDVGNDLAYEVPVKTVLDWVQGCVDRLLSMGARVVLSDLPMEALRSLSARKFRLFRTLLFPQCQLGWPEMLWRAELLSEGLRELAKSQEIPFFVGRKEWYGLDPIHLRRRCHAEKWAQILSQVTAVHSDLPRHRSGWLYACYLRQLRPESWSFFSISRRAIQPSGQLRDGSTVSLY